MVAECLKAGACDVGFLGFNPSRTTDVSFAPPHWLVPFTYLVPAGSSIRSVADADRNGVRIAVVRGHEATMALSRIVKNAELVTAEVPDTTFDLLRTGRADAFASNLAVLLTYLPKMPGAIILEDHYGTNLGSMAVSKDQSGRLAYVREFIEEAKVSGMVQRAIERADQRGLRVAPLGNATAPK
jgi:polar amino acid transport system substrate-binding protein